MKRGAEDTDISVVEGVMGYYDGLGGIDTKASAYDLAAVTKTPAVLIVDTRGMSLSALADQRFSLTIKEPYQRCDPEPHVPDALSEVKSRVEENSASGFWLCAEAYGAESGEPSSGAGAPRMR